MKDSGISWIREIPRDWNVIRNKNVFSCSKELIGERWSNTQLLSLTTNGIREATIGKTTGKVPDSYETYQTVRPDNIVVCLFDLDVSAVFAGRSDFYGMISPAYKVLSCNKGFYAKFYHYWFTYIFQGRKFMYQAKNLRYSLTYDEFSSLHIVAPSLEEQIAISNFLDQKCQEINELIALQDAIINELRDYKQSIINETVLCGNDKNVKMRDTGVEWIGKVPNHWSIKHIKWLLHERKERSANGKEQPLSMSQKLGLVPTSMLGDIPNPASTYIGAKKVSFGNLVFNKLKAHLGVFSVSQYEGIVSPDYAVYFSNNTNVKYLEYLFKTPMYINEFRKKITGVGEGLSRLYTSDLFSILSIVPPFEEQQTICDYLEKKCSEIDSLIAIKQEKIDELKAYKQSLIYECVTGKREIPTS